ncbi:chromatin remodelling complex Rsc7/Swp82 subunit-domain-containing protein [Lactarius indigo]|nr:chromatin remodelling complex Rsc7/Swp82 subunit-domain-containing protein [Lactarius indigo]
MASGKIIIRPRKVHDSTSNSTLVGPSRLEAADDCQRSRRACGRGRRPYASPARTSTRPRSRRTHRQRTRRTCTGAWARTRDGGEARVAGLTGGEEGTPGAEGGVLHDEEPFSIVQGKVYVIEGDEFVTEDDPKGDTKIDRNGNLLGGRRFKAQTFNLPNRHPERMYMLAIDAARTSGFRDSLYYFRRNPLAHKLNATPSEKEYLIEIGKLGSHLRTRSVTLITARSAFKLHGSKTLIDGRWVVLADITEKGLKPGDPKGDRAGGTQGIYRAGGPTTLFGSAGWGPYSDGPLNAVRKSLLNRDGLNEENWMLIAAQRTAEASAEWAKQRRRALVPYGGIFGATAPSSSSHVEKKEDGGEEERVKGKADGRRQGHADEQDQGAPEQREDESAATDARRRKRARLEEKVPRGVYEPHIGIVLYRADTQPTRARWEGLKDSAEKRQVLGGTKAGNGAWALAWVDTVMELAASEGDHEVGHTAAEERRRLLELAEADLNS